MHMIYSNQQYFLLEWDVCLVWLGDGTVTYLVVLKPLAGNIYIEFWFAVVSR
jgi:hypothetical protein